MHMTWLAQWCRPALVLGAVFIISARPIEAQTSYSAKLARIGTVDTLYTDQDTCNEQFADLVACTETYEVITNNNTDGTVTMDLINQDSTDDRDCTMGDSTDGEVIVGQQVLTAEGTLAAEYPEGSPLYWNFAPTTSKDGVPGVLFQVTDTSEQPITCQAFLGLQAGRLLGQSVQDPDNYTTTGPFTTSLQPISSGSKEKFSTGWIVAIVMIVLVVLMCIAAGCIWHRRRRAYDSLKE